MSCTFVKLYLSIDDTSLAVKNVKNGERKAKQKERKYMLYIRFVLRCSSSYKGERDEMGQCVHVWLYSSLRLYASPKASSIRFIFTYIKNR